MTARYRLVASGAPYGIGESIGEAATLRDCARLAREKLSADQRAAAYRLAADGDDVARDAEGCPLPPRAAWERWPGGRLVRLETA